MTDEGKLQPLITCCPDARLRRAVLHVGSFRVRAVQCAACNTLSLATNSRRKDQLFRHLLAPFWSGRYHTEPDPIDTSHA